MWGFFINTAMLQMFVILFEKQKRITHINTKLDEEKRVLSIK